MARRTHKEALAAKGMAEYVARLQQIAKEFDPKAAETMAQAVTRGLISGGEYISFLQSCNAEVFRADLRAAGF